MEKRVLNDEERFQSPNQKESLKREGRERDTETEKARLTPPLPEPVTHPTQDCFHCPVLLWVINAKPSIMERGEYTKQRLLRSELPLPPLPPEFRLLLGRPAAERWRQAEVTASSRYARETGAASGWLPLFI